MIRPITRAATMICALGMASTAARAQGGRAAQGASCAEEPAELRTPTGTLYGTLCLPRTGKAPYPVALIIAGSGPTDRNGNSPLLPGANNSLKMLAEGLAGRRIASLRYDKRGIGESRAAMPREEDLRFETYIEDAAGWAEQLRRDRRFSTLTIAGHSEGSLIGMVAAREAKANAFASLAGAGRPAPEILHEQLSKQLPPPMLAEADTILAALSAGRRVDTVPPMLMALFRPSVQPYLISWFRYDPRKEIARLTIPVLIVQGTTDLQVDVADARALAAADPRAKLVVVEGMNHIFKDVPADPQQQLASYGNPDLPVDPRLITAVAELIRGVR